MYYFLLLLKILIVVAVCIMIGAMFSTGHILGGVVTAVGVLLIEYGDKLPKTWYENIFNRDKPPKE